MTASGRLVVAALLAGVVVQVALLAPNSGRWVQGISLLRQGEEAAQRTLNGPLVPLARQLQQELPANSCLQFVHPDLAEARRTRRFYTFFNIYVLGNHLYPRAVRLPAGADEALNAPECTGRRPFVLVWLEYEHRGSSGFDRVNGLLEGELRTPAGDWGGRAAGALRRRAGQRGLPVRRPPGMNGMDGLRDGIACAAALGWCWAVGAPPPGSWPPT